jgi:hypothetical protein
MIRLAWLQSRTQTAIAVAGLLAVVVIAIVTGPDLVHIYDTIIAPCTAQKSCSSNTIQSFLHNDNTLRNSLSILVVVVPGIIGVFWGAPLVSREIESGTYRLAWTQSVTRTRWLAAKIAMVGLIAMAVTGLLSLVVTWWARPLDRVGANRFGSFDVRGIVPIGYAAFGFALGITAGVVIRRTLPAMATVAVVFTAVRVAMVKLVRPHLFAPDHVTFALDSRATGFGPATGGGVTLFPSPPTIANAWFYSTKIVDGTGHGLTTKVLNTACPHLADIYAPAATAGNPTSAPSDMLTTVQTCVREVAARYHVVTAYQPASRYWAFQWYEMSICIAAAVAICGFCFWWIRRRA